MGFSLDGLHAHKLDGVEPPFLGLVSAWAPEKLATLIFLWLACTCANEVAKSHLICARAWPDIGKFCALIFLWAWLHVLKLGGAETPFLSLMPALLIGKIDSFDLV
ncbi:hypothetical protein [Mucilaginibacter arboris]|nr:hypothetical protein [Mucilaginibacter arboris]